MNLGQLLGSGSGRGLNPLASAHMENGSPVLSNVAGCGRESNAISLPHARCKDLSNLLNVHFFSLFKYKLFAKVVTKHLHTIANEN